MLNDLNSQIVEPLVTGGGLALKSWAPLGYKISLGAKDVLGPVSLFRTHKSGSKKKQKSPHLLQDYSSEETLTKGIITELRERSKEPTRYVEALRSNRRKSLLCIWLKKKREEIALSRYNENWSHKEGSDRQGLYFSNCQRCGTKKGRRWR